MKNQTWRVKISIILSILCLFLGYSMAGCTSGGAPVKNITSNEAQTVTINAINFEVSAVYNFFTWKELPGYGIAPCSLPMHELDPLWHL